MTTLAAAPIQRTRQNPALVLGSMLRYRPLWQQLADSLNRCSGDVQRVAALANDRRPLPLQQEHDHRRIGRDAAHFR